MFAGASCEDDLAFGVAQFTESGGGHVEGDRNLGSEHCGRCIDVLDVFEDPRPEPDLVES